jgi:hypothetical protein
MSRALAGCIALLLLSTPAAAQPKHHHFWRSKKFWIAFTIDTGATLADFGEAQNAWAVGSSENDPIFGTARPGFGRMTAIGMPITFAVSYASFRMSGSRHRWARALWPLPVAYDAADHVYWAASNARVPCSDRDQDVCGSLRPKF